jgi:phospholipid/cholesterol/gamma-HCH transport system substrate-binding protein
MADPQKVSFAQLRVGIMAIVAMAIVAVLIFLLTSEQALFTRKFPLRTFMDDSSGMAEGAPVRLNGIPAGQVDALKLSGSKDPRRIVEIDMSIRYQYLTEIPKDSMAGIAASNLLGDKFIDITKGRATEHVQPGDEIRSAPNQDIPQLMAESAGMLAQFQSLLTRVNGILTYVEEGKGNLGKFLKDEELFTRLNNTVGEAQEILTTVRTGKGTIGRILNDPSLYDSLRAPLDKLNLILADLEQGQGTAGKLLKDDALFSDLRKVTAQANQLLADLQAGRGTAGKLLKDEALHNNIVQLIAKVDTTVDKLNSGQGTMGQLLVNPQLYESLNGATSELRLLLQQARTNPKKFFQLKISLF